LNLTTAGNVPTDAYSIELDLPKFYNSTTAVKIDDWNNETIYGNKYLVSRKVVNNQYYEYTFNFTKAGNYYIRPLLNGQELRINNGKLKVVASDPTYDLTVKKYESGKFVESVKQDWNLPVVDGSTVQDPNNVISPNA
jgi:hypothetical protein